MIASPSDVGPERLAAQAVIHAWNALHSEDRGLVLLPLAWETHSAPAMGLRAQEIINRQLVDSSDLLVAAFWTRLGTPTGESPSGTIEEIEEHIKAGKPVMLYFSNQPVHPDTLDETQYKALRDFKHAARQRGLIEDYDSPDQFREKFARQLTRVIIERFPSQSNSGPDTLAQARTHVIERNRLRRQAFREVLADLDPAASDLLSNAAKDRNGTVIAPVTFAGLSVETNQKQFVDRGDPRSEARSRRMLEQLASLGLLAQRDEEGQVFAVTDDGYRVADAIEQSMAAAKHELLALLHQLRMTGSSLPRDRSKGEQIRDVTLWRDTDPDRLRTLAAQFGMPAAKLAGEAHRQLATVHEMATSVKHTPRERGFNWQKFDWDRWVIALNTTETTLISLADLIDSDWRSKV